MKKSKLLLFATAAIMLLLLSCGYAQDYLNVVKTNSATESFSLDNVDKIVLDNNNIYVKQSNGSSYQYFYDNIFMLNFLNPLTTVIDIPVNANNVDVFYSVMLKEVSVKSSTTIKNISIYNTLGRLVIQSSPNSETARISLQYLPVGLYIVSVINVEGRVSKKIIKN